MLDGIATPDELVLMDDGKLEKGKKIPFTKQRGLD